MTEHGGGMGKEDLDLVLLAKKKDCIIAKATTNLWTVYYKGSFAQMSTVNLKASLDKLPNKPWWKIW